MRDVYCYNVMGMYQCEIIFATFSISQPNLAVLQAVGVCTFVDDFGQVSGQFKLY